MTGAAAATPAVDRHVVIVTVAGSFTPAGERLTGPVTGVDKLETLDRVGARPGSVAAVSICGDRRAG